MTDFSSRYNIPLLTTGQTNAHLTVNEALQRLEHLSTLTVESTLVTQEPTNPVDGQAWLLLGGASGVNWSTHAGEVAFYLGGWHFITPREGLTVWDSSVPKELRFSQGVWADSNGGGGGAGNADALTVAISIPFDDIVASSTYIHPIFRTPGRIHLIETYALLANQSTSTGAYVRYSLVSGESLYGGPINLLFSDQSVTDSLNAQSGVPGPGIIQPSSPNSVWMGIKILTKSGTGPDHFTVNLRYRNA